MAYKIIKEYNKNGIHELTIYKYNISHDEMVRFVIEAKKPYEMKVYTSGYGQDVDYTFDIRDGDIKWYRYGNNSKYMKLFC